MICKRCNIDKSTDCFNKAPRNSSGFHYSCKQCLKEFSKLRRYEQHRRSDPNYQAYNKKRNKEYAETICGRAKYLFISAKQRAIEKGLPITITAEFIEFVLMIGVCQKTGICFDLKSSNSRKRRNAFAPSVDRKNSFEGYTYENVQIVCDMYNHGKGQHSDEEFILFCNMVARAHPR